MTVKCSKCKKGVNLLPNAFAKKDSIKCKHCGEEGVFKPAAAEAPRRAASSSKPKPETKQTKAAEHAQETDPGTDDFSCWN